LKAGVRHPWRTRSAGRRFAGSSSSSASPFDDPETRLPAIDRLEGFHPGGPCLYRRVLTSAQVHGIVIPAWLYVGEDFSGRLTPLGGSRWPRKP